MIDIAGELFLVRSNANSFQKSAFLSDNKIADLRSILVLAEGGYWRLGKVSFLESFTTGRGR